MEMEIRARKDVEIGEDVTPCLPPLCFSLHDSFLQSHCSSCFSSLPAGVHDSDYVQYCSSQCSSADFPLHFSTAEFHLFQSLPSVSSLELTTDLRAALRLLYQLQLPVFQDQLRIAGLLTNREKLLLNGGSENEDEILTLIRDGGKAMAVARSIRDGGVEFSGDAELEEAVLCAVLTNAVEVQDNIGRSIGIAVYGCDFSWINHSCSPNACYRFLVSPPPLIQEFSGNDDCSSSSEMIKGCQGYGPRVIVRSIKGIKRGEEVTIAYTDLLHPKEMRQLELWLKYRFICCCRRCSAVPSTYVDRALQGMSTGNVHPSNLNSNCSVDKEREAKRLFDYVDEVITEFLSVGDADSCCEKLENMLNEGLSHEQLDVKDGNPQPNLVLHPLHHLSLKAYTTLASAYKIRASDLLNLHSETDKHHMEAFNMSRTSAAYSLLLAGAAHHLFHVESSLIASIANFWTSAGESLLNLAKGSDLPSLTKHKCPNCSLMDKFEANLFHTEARIPDFEDICNDFLCCVTNITSKAWSFLSHDNPHLKLIKDPIDFSWLGSTDFRNRFDIQTRSFSNRVVSDCEFESKLPRFVVPEYSKHGRLQIFQLGIHCLMYGGILANICYGQTSHLTCTIQDTAIMLNLFH